MTRNCGICGKENIGSKMFFHSKCCNAHFEGIVDKDRHMTIVCEKCGKHCGYVVAIRKGDVK